MLELNHSLWFTCWGFPSVHQAEFLFFSLVAPWLCRNCLCNHISGHHWVLTLKMDKLNSRFWFFFFLAFLWPVCWVDFGHLPIQESFWMLRCLFVSTWLEREREREILSNKFIKKRRKYKLFEFLYNSSLLYGAATWRGQLSLLSLPLSDADIEINLKN